MHAGLHTGFGAGGGYMGVYRDRGGIIGNNATYVRCIAEVGITVGGYGP